MAWNVWSQAAGLQAVDVAVLIDRESGGRQLLESKGYRLHTVSARALRVCLHPVTSPPSALLPSETLAACAGLCKTPTSNPNLSLDPSRCSASASCCHTGTPPGTSTTR